MVRTTPQHRSRLLDRVSGGIRLEILFGRDEIMVIEEMAAIDRHLPGPWQILSPRYGNSAVVIKQ
jgi:hypothetical protein